MLAWRQLNLGLCVAILTGGCDGGSDVVPDTQPTTTMTADATTSTQASPALTDAATPSNTTASDASQTGTAGDAGSTGTVSPPIDATTIDAAPPAKQDASASDAGADSAQDTGAAQGDAGTQTTVEDYGQGDGQDVITIGDSWMSLGLGAVIEGALDRAGTHYRHYAVAGTLLLNGQIPGQYDQAVAENPDIKTVLLTGGGNDIMFTGGCNTKEACAMSVERITEALNELYTKMAGDGVTCTVYIQYSKNAGTTPSDTRPDMTDPPAICLTDKIRCVGIETTDLVASTDTLDGIHPNNAASDRIVARVLAEMEKHGCRR